VGSQAELAEEADSAAVGKRGSRGGTPAAEAGPGAGRVVAGMVRRGAGDEMLVQVKGLPGQGGLSLA
jgi:hypothetical protein